MVLARQWCVPRGHLSGASQSIWSWGHFSSRTMSNSEVEDALSCYLVNIVCWFPFSCCIPHVPYGCRWNVYKALSSEQNSVQTTKQFTVDNSTEIPETCLTETLLIAALTDNYYFGISNVWHLGLADNSLTYIKHIVGSM